MSVTTAKNWDAHVVHAEEIARSSGFRALRDRIVAEAAPRAGETAVDVGAGTGLLSLALAERGLQVWAIDIAPCMCDYLKAKATSAQLTHIEVAVGSAVSLPLVDDCADVVVSNYCFHHLSDHGKRLALAEARRVLRPGGRFVFGDMMFALALTQARDRRVLADKVRAMARKGPAGILRLAKNGARIITGRWERPARADWWRQGLADAGFVDVQVEVLGHEGGIAIARTPGETPLAGATGGAPQTVAGPTGCGRAVTQEAAILGHDDVHSRQLLDLMARRIAVDDTPSAAKPQPAGGRPVRDDIVSRPAGSKVGPLPS